MLIPGLQNPHWTQWHSRNATCTGCRVPSSSASRSMVSTVAPSAWTASTLHDFTDRPSRWTVHAPQLLVSHPITVPVFPSFSRRYCTSSIRGSPSSDTRAPSTVRLILVIETPAFRAQRLCGVRHARAPAVGERLPRCERRAGLWKSQILLRFLQGRASLTGAAWRGGARAPRGGAAGLSPDDSEERSGSERIQPGRTVRRPLRAP